MRARFIHPAGLIALLFALGLGEAVTGDDSAPSNARAVDTRFIPADAFLAYVVFPARILTAPSMAKVDLKETYAEVDKSLGFPLATLEQAEMVFAYRTSKVGNREMLRGVAGMEIRLSKPLDRDTFVKHAMAYASPEKVEYQGKSYYRPEMSKGGFRSSAPAIYFIDDRTFLFGDEAAVTSMMSANDANPPIAQLLAKADPTAVLNVAYTFNDQIQKQLGDALDAGQVPPPLQPFADLADSLPSATLSVKTLPEISLALDIQAKDGATAEKLASLAPSAKQLAGQLVATLRKEAAAAPPDAKAPLEYGLDTLDKIVAELAAQRNGNDVVIRIKGLGTIDEFGTKFLIPAIAQSRAAARHVQSLNNLAQLSRAMLMHENEHGSFPPRAIYSKDGKPLLSWRVSMLPYLNEKKLFEQFHLDEPWDSPNNKPLIANMPDVYLDPDGKALGEGKTRYVVPIGKGTIFEAAEGIKVRQITDGPSYTILILEVGEDKAVTWTKPDDMPFDPAKPLAGLGEISEHGFGAAFADGSVRLLRKSIDPDLFRKLILRADGLPIDASKY